ncbi:MAG: type II secretion system protein M [Gammaproteobacteria bacterium]
MEQFKKWFKNLTLRERQMVLSAVAIIVVFLLYQSWSSFDSHVEQLKERVNNQQEIKSWMQQASSEVKQLRGSGVTDSRPKGKQLLISLIDRSARENKLESSLQKVQPEGQQGVRIWLEKAAFDNIVIWLDNLQHQHGLVITDISIDSQDVTGTVNARVLVESL